jgi:hypothetical protein
MELATRRVLFAGCTNNPDESWMYQAARNLSDAEEGFLRGKKHRLIDRDAKFSEAFRVTLEQVGTEGVRLPPRSPDLDPNIERFIRSVKEECLKRKVFFGERSLHVAVVAFLVHYLAEHNHKALGNRLIDPGEDVGRTNGAVACLDRLCGTLRYSCVAITAKRLDLVWDLTAAPRCMIAGMSAGYKFTSLTPTDESDILPGGLMLTEIAAHPCF